jgi:hypothetical protein
MGHSIQEYLKKINRKLTFIDILSLFITLCALIVLFLVISHKQSVSRVPVVYKEAVEDAAASNISGGEQAAPGGRPFASSNGKTYTFSWCQRSNMIAAKNKIYFSSEQEAKNSGRTLSKLCQK